MGSHVTLSRTATTTTHGGDAEDAVEVSRASVAIAAAAAAAVATTDGSAAAVATIAATIAAGSSSQRRRVSAAPQLGTQLCNNCPTFCQSLCQWSLGGGGGGYDSSCTCCCCCCCCGRRGQRAPVAAEAKEGTPEEQPRGLPQLDDVAARQALA